MYTLKKPLLNRPPYTNNEPSEARHNPANAPACTYLNGYRLIIQILAHTLALTPPKQLAVLIPGQKSDVKNSTTTKHKAWSTFCQPASQPTEDDENDVDSSEASHIKRPPRRRRWLPSYDEHNHPFRVAHRLN